MVNPWHRQIPPRRWGRGDIPGLRGRFSGTVEGGRPAAYPPNWKMFAGSSIQARSR
jgi:hypothetical protein